MAIIGYLPSIMMMVQDLIVKNETTKCGQFGEVTLDRKHLLDPSCVYSRRVQDKVILENDPSNRIW